MTRTRHLLLACGLLAMAACTSPADAPAPAAAPGATDGARSPWRYTRDEAALGEIRLFAGNFAPVGWLPADGRALPADQYPQLVTLLGTRFGGDGEATINLPDLPPVTFGDTERRYLIAYDGAHPGYEGDSEGLQLGYCGEVRLWPLETTPVGWLPCDGAELKINDYQMLYSSLETTYGGDGRTTFKLPKLPNVGPARYLINTRGAWPDPDSARNYAGIRLRGQFGLFAGRNAPPYRWYACDGTVLPIQLNTSLFSLLGVDFGGNGKSTFALPTLTLAANPAVRYRLIDEGIFPMRP